MNENNIDIDQACEIDYRHGEYPGKIVVIMKILKTLVLNLKGQLNAV